MILSADLATEDAAHNLYEAEKFFQENMQAQALRRTNKLSVDMELLEPYVLVTIKPITSLSVKNKLHYLLQSKFPKNFMVDNIKTDNIKIVVPKEKKHQKVTEKEVDKEVNIQTKVISKNTNRYSEKKKSLLGDIQKFWRTLDSEWLGLIFLALAGFLLVYRSAKQMSKIKSLQEEVSKYQTKIEGEMDTMGDKYA